MDTRLTKYACFILVSRSFIVKDLIKLFIKEIVCLHDLPYSIVSDKDHVFLCSF